MKKNSTVTDKPWGREILLTPPDTQYVGKLIFVDDGARISLQYHDRKTETQCLVSGRAEIWLENDQGELDKFEMEKNVGYTIRPGQRHRLVGVEDAVVIEASTPELGTTYRVEDDYDRQDETEEMRFSSRNS